MGIDQAIPLMNRWARGPLPLSGAVCDGQAIWVRLSGERRALAEARAAIALDQVPEGGSGRRCAQPALSRPMLRAKVDALEAGHPDIIATTNIGCYAYLRQEARVPVVH